MASERAYRGWDGELVKGGGEEVEIQTNVNGPPSMAGTGHRTMSCYFSDSQTLGVISQTQISLTLNCIHFQFFHVAPLGGWCPGNAPTLRFHRDGAAS